MKETRFTLEGSQELCGCSGMMNLCRRLAQLTADALRAQRGRGGYVHSVTVQARSGRVGVYKEGSSSYRGLAEWKVESL